MLARTASAGEVMTIGCAVDAQMTARSRSRHAETGEEKIELPHALQAGDARGSRPPCRLKEASRSLPAVAMRSAPSTSGPRSRARRARGGKA